MIQKEESLDKKLETAEQKEQSLTARNGICSTSTTKLEVLRKQQIDELEHISGLSRDEAKSMLLESIERDVRHDAALIIRSIEQEARDEGEKRARNIIGLAIQRCAAIMCGNDSIRRSSAQR